MRVKAYSEDNVNFDKTIDIRAVKMAFQRRLIDGPINRYYFLYVP